MNLQGKSLTSTQPYATIILHSNTVQVYIFTGFRPSDGTFQLMKRHSYWNKLHKRLNSVTQKIHNFLLTWGVEQNSLTPLPISLQMCYTSIVKDFFRHRRYKLEYISTQALRRRINTTFYINQPVLSGFLFAISACILPGLELHKRHRAYADHPYSVQMQT